MGDIIPVRVALRIRPLSSKEIENGCDSVIDVIPGRPQITVRNTEKAFTYDFAHSTSCTQSEIYDSCVRPLIEQLFKGYNATVLAYGQTGSGKTFSMGTANREEETPIHLEGVIPRAVRDIFDKIAQLGDSYDFCVRVAFIELYKEKLYDLLSGKSKMKEDCIVDLREDPVKGVVITNLTEVAVHDLKTTMAQLEHGSIKRVTAATAMNNTSSRSHAIFTICIEGTRKSDDESDEASNIVAKFHLVDLAGSERAKKTLATGVRYKEGVAINLGLLALGNVISALGDDSGPKTHIPYRDSKLTRLLQDSLGGNSHTLMIACVSPADTNLEETLSTLRYADRARKIKNKPIVNQDGKDAENAKLRREIAELKVQLLNGGGGGGSTKIDSKQLEELKMKNSLLMTENRELTSALMSCQDELSHMNEKLLLTEDSSIKMKTKMEELAAETEALLKRTPLKADVENVLRKIRDIIDAQKDSEKTMAEHDLSRFEDRSSINTSQDDQNHEDREEIGAAEILKQNALATQLATLNKQLAQKEQYAVVLNQQEDKLKEVREKYEDQLNQLESQLKSLEKEKDQLHQQNRAEPATSKIAEQRRKRIQELEATMADLKKKLVEQQRMIKMNEKNVQKLNQLGDEILTMKQAKVRLIRQMKEESERVRTWKMQKEKEVLQLKQTERKQQAQIAKMANLHSKQQNVLKRKMEEAVAANKRLKDVMDKQKAARKSSSYGKQGLVGAAERMRNLVSQELDVVVSVKEAQQSREQLLKDRITLTKELTALKNKQRMTMTNSERDDMHTRMKELEEELALRNAQISELQKQIMNADDSNEQHHGSTNAKWWDSLSTMTEAKIALQYLFEKAADSMASHASAQSTLSDLRSMYDEAIKNIQALEEEITELKDEHSEKLVDLGKEYEERINVLLMQLTTKATDENVGLKDSEIQKFSQLQEALLKMNQDYEVNKKSKKSGTSKKVERYTLEEVLKDEEAEEELDDTVEEEQDVDDDPDWYQTPLLKRIRKIRETNIQQKRKFGDTMTATTHEADTDEVQGPKAKRSNSSTGSGKCSCQKGCKSKRCQCVKAGRVCSDECRCPLGQCKNRHDHERLAFADKTNNSEAAETSETADSTAGTMSLLNDTYQIPELSFKKSSDAQNADENASPVKVQRGATMFKSPSSGPPYATPYSHHRLGQIFKSPIRE